jgi:hypothetical protein
MKARPALPADIKQLMILVRKGRLFDVQKWIAEGKRTVPPEPYCFSPLRVALSSKPRKHSSRFFDWLTSVPDGISTQAICSKT